MIGPAVKMTGKSESEDLDGGPGLYMDHSPSSALSQHSPGSTSSVSSNGSHVGAYTRHNNPRPRPFKHNYPNFGHDNESSHAPLSIPLNCDTQQTVTSTDTSTLPPSYMGWESPGGTTHYTPSPMNMASMASGYQYDGHTYPVVITPPSSGCESGQGPGVTVTMCNPSPTGDGMTANAGQHIVHFHVHQGEAISLQLGEQVQMIQGPATVRMVSINHEPPVPLPMQVPPGHVVQQIVDEHGVLQHVILSQEPPTAPATHPVVPAPPIVPPNSIPTHFGSGGSSPSAPQPDWSPSQPYPPTDTTTRPPPPAHTPTTHSFPTTTPPPSGYWSSPTARPEQRDQSETRCSRSQTHERLRRKVNKRQSEKPSGSSSPSLSVQSTPPASPAKNRVPHNYNNSSDRSWRSEVQHTARDSEESGIGHEEDQEETNLLLEVLSNIHTPRVPEVLARSALLVWSPPVRENEPELEVVEPIPDSDLEYEVLLSDKGKDGKYRSIFSGASLECRLTDLRPHTEYHIRVHAVLKSHKLRGGASDTVSFLTKACEPDQPNPPKMLQRSKTTINLRWNPPVDNGAHILHYILEMDEWAGAAAVAGHFVPIYTGRAKTYNVPKLQSSTPYKFRLIAVNELGRSRPSEIVMFTTQGSPPSQPVPPEVADVTVSAMRLLWSKRPCDDEFTLQMDEPASGHGYINQYNGPEVQHVVTGLHRNTTYRFRIRAHNEMGASPYSSDVSYVTRPAQPGPPCKLATKGRVHTNSFRVVWSGPADTGGSDVTGFLMELDNGEGWQSVYHGLEMEFHCDHLQPGSQYRVRVAAESAGGVGDYSDTCFITTEPEVPGQPSPPSLLDKPKAVSVNLCWQAPEVDGGANVTEFEIDMTSPDNTTRRVFRGRETECMVASLLPGRPYLFQVRAHNRAGAGPWSQPLEAVSGAGPPDTPKEPRVMCRSGTLAQVSWEEPINNGAIIKEYRLEMAAVATIKVKDLEESEDEVDEAEEDLYDPEEADYATSEDEDNQESDDECVEENPPVEEADESEICDTVDDGLAVESAVEEKEIVWEVAYSGPGCTNEIKSLIPATQYQLRVCAINSAGPSSYSCNVVMMTPPSPPAAPGTLSLQQTTCSSLSLSWSRPNNNGEAIMHYTVEWGHDMNTLSSTTTDRSRVSIADLKPDTSYIVRVQAHNSLGPGPVSPILKVRTKALPPAPPKLDCINFNHNSIKLKWGDVKDSIAANYILENENTRKQWFQIYNGPAHSFKANKLNENTEYRYRIAAMTDAGQGPFSTAFNFKTAFAHPGAVRAAPRVSQTTDSTSLVEWGAVRPVATGDQLRYQVELTKVKDGSIIKNDAGTDLQFRFQCLEAKSEYTVRVAAVRTPCGAESASLVGPLSPASGFTTLVKTTSTAVVAPQASSSTPRPQGQRVWSDSDWAMAILGGFTIFALVVAFFCQQLMTISL